MKNWKLIPKDSQVAEFIECYWFLKKEPEDVSYEWPKLYPDPAAHLILANNDQKYRYQIGAQWRSGCGSHWILPHLKTHIMDHSTPFQIMGIKFKVGALYSLHSFGLSRDLDAVCHATSDQLADLRIDDILSILATALNEKEEARDLLDSSLNSVFQGLKEDKHSALVREILPILADTSLSQIGALLHRSQRTIERSFLRVTNFTLKQCASMIRLEMMLDQLYGLNPEEIDWVDLAIKYKFSDQPHLIRYIKKTIGETPNQYSRQRDLTIDVYGKFEV